MEVASPRVRQSNHTSTTSLSKLYFVPIFEGDETLHILNWAEIVFPLFEVILVSAPHSLVTLTSLLTNLASMPQASLRSIDTRQWYSIFKALAG